MTAGDIEKIWQLRRNRAAGILDNIHSIIAQAAVKFGGKESAHMFKLIDDSWAHEDRKSKEKLMVLVGRIGKIYN